MSVISQNNRSSIFHIWTTETWTFSEKQRTEICWEVGKDTWNEYLFQIPTPPMIPGGRIQWMNEWMNPKIRKADVDFDKYCKNKCHGQLTTRSFPPLKERLNI